MSANPEVTRVPAFREADEIEKEFNWQYSQRAQVLARNDWNKSGDYQSPGKNSDASMAGK